eukprot:s4576_g2.t1
MPSDKGESKEGVVYKPGEYKKIRQDFIKAKTEALGVKPREAGRMWNDSAERAALMSTLSRTEQVMRGYWYMGKFGGPSPKRHVAWSNDEGFVQELLARGVAVVAPKHLNCRFIKEFVAEGCGFVLGEILVGSVYLKSGVGLQCSPNPEMLAALAVELKGCRKWVLGGDWNCPAQDFVKMSLESVMHGKICSEGVPTSDSGRTLDFFFLSNDLANLGEPSTSWEVRFRPHAAISLTLRQELLLQPLPSLVGVGKVPPAQWKIGDVDVKCDPASLWLGCFAQQVFKLTRSRNNCRNVNPI